jgi:hypothetical protein
LQPWSAPLAVFSRSRCASSVKCDHKGGDVQDYVTRTGTVIGSSV